MIKSQKLPPIHPGTILEKEFLNPRKISQTELAASTNIPIKLIEEICQATKPINAEVALRLGTYFGTSAELWLGLQQDYEQECLENIREKQEKQIKKEVRPLPGLLAKTNNRSRKHL